MKHRPKLRKRLLCAGLATLLLGCIGFQTVAPVTLAASSPLVGPDTNNNQGAYLNVALAKSQGTVYQFMKASEGTGFTDSFFKDGRTNAVAGGLIPGAYHFLDKGNGAAQCDHFMSIVNSTGGANGLMLAVDVEKQNATTGPSYQDLLDFLGHCEALTPGRIWIVYTGAWYWGAAHTAGYLHNPPAPANTVLWISMYVGGSGNAFTLLNSVVPQGSAGEPYASNPIQGWPDYAFRQYSSTGTVANMNGDVNVTYKGLDYLKSLASISNIPTPPPAPVKVGITSTPSGNGYWEVASDGGVFTYGDGVFYGSLGNTSLKAPIAGMAPTPDGLGYWLVGQDGGVFTFGDAAFYGSAGTATLKAPIIGMAATPDGKGYWLVGADGGIFTYGDAAFYGSAAGTQLSKPVVGMAPTTDGKGYWLVSADGGIFTYGDAGYYGSAGGTALTAPVVGMAPSPDGKGYWLAGADGGIFTYGDAGFYGSKGGGKGYVGLTGTAALHGYRLVNLDASAPDFEPPPVIPPPPPPPPDTTPPVIAITQPQTGTTVSGSVDVEATATDDVGVAKVEFYVDNDLRGATTAAPYSFTWNATNASTGLHTVTAKAYDAAGNATSAVDTLTVNNTPAVVPGDFNNDQAVDIRDFNILIIHWGQAVTPNTNGDLDNNSTVDIRDLNQFIVDWGTYLSVHTDG